MECLSHFSQKSLKNADFSKFWTFFAKICSFHITLTTIMEVFGTSTDHNSL